MQNVLVNSQFCEPQRHNTKRQDKSGPTPTDYSKSAREETPMADVMNENYCRFTSNSSKEQIITSNMYSKNYDLIRNIYL